MEITWYGHACFRLRDKGAIVITDPHDPSVGYSLPKVRADIVTVSHNYMGLKKLAAQESLKVTASTLCRKRPRLCCWITSKASKRSAQ
ncbi:MAG: hypothetical protein GTN71_17470 [Anaerolineae bacterium]|nr:hypothetical protein [Anaerolineae bacterium]